MAIERCLVCDKCGNIIHSESTVRRLRKEARYMSTRINNRDYCLDCRPSSQPLPTYQEVRGILKPSNEA